MPQPIKRAEPVSLLLPATTAAGAFINFPTTPNLEGVWITGFECFTVSGLAQNEAQIAVVTAADALRFTVSLQSGSDQVIQDVPYSKGIAQLNAGVYPDLVPVVLDLNKSGVRCNLTPGTLPVVLFFVFYYCFPEEAWWDPNTGPARIPGT